MGPAIAPSMALTLPKTRISHSALLDGVPSPGTHDRSFVNGHDVSRPWVCRSVLCRIVSAMDGAIEAYKEVFTAVRQGTLRHTHGPTAALKRSRAPAAVTEGTTPPSPKERPLRHRATAAAVSATTCRRWASTPTALAAASPDPFAAARSRCCPASARTPCVRRVAAG